MTSKTAPRLTVNQLAIAFGVTIATISNWRKGTPTKDPLPEIASAKPRVFVLQSAAEKWAKANDVPVVVPFDRVLAGETAQPVRPGPKPRVAPGAGKAKAGPKKPLASAAGKPRKVAAVPAEKADNASGAMSAAAESLGRGSLKGLQSAPSRR